MPDQVTADEQILTILAKLQAALGDDGVKLEPGEVVQVRKILDYGETLVELARYEEAKGIVRARWRSVILGLGALVSALALINARITSSSSRTTSGSARIFARKSWLFFSNLVTVTLPPHTETPSVFWISSNVIAALRIISSHRTIQIIRPVRLLCA